MDKWIERIEFGQSEKQLGPGEGDKNEDPLRYHADAGRTIPTAPRDRQQTTVDVLEFVSKQDHHCRLKKRSVVHYADPSSAFSVVFHLPGLLTTCHRNLNSPCKQPARGQSPIHTRPYAPQAFRSPLAQVYRPGGFPRPRPDYALRVEP